jgi:curved DNA-binding protein CbpA
LFTEGGVLMNYYEILQISENASKEVIKCAYIALAKKYHPDLQSQENKSISEEKMKLINLAYETLIDDDKRKDYDDKYFNRDNPYQTSAENKNWNNIYSYVRTRKVNFRSKLIMLIVFFLAGLLIFKVYTANSYAWNFYYTAKLIREEVTQCSSQWGDAYQSNKLTDRKDFINSRNKNKYKVDKLMEKIKHPPTEYTEEYSLITDIYSDYQSIYSYTVTPKLFSEQSNADRILYYIKNCCEDYLKLNVLLKQKS